MDLLIHLRPVFLHSPCPPTPPRYSSVLSRLRTVTPLPRLRSRTKKHSLYTHKIITKGTQLKLNTNSTIPTWLFSFLHYIVCLQNIPYVSCHLLGRNRCRNRMKKNNRNRIPGASLTQIRVWMWFIRAQLTIVDEIARCKPLGSLSLSDRCRSVRH